MYCIIKKAHTPAIIAPLISVNESFLPAMIKASTIPGKEAWPTASPIKDCLFNILIVPTIQEDIAIHIVPSATTMKEY